MKKAKTVEITNIQWDTDGVRVKLPKQMTLTIPSSIHNKDEAEEWVSDELSNQTGFCHCGFACSPEIQSFFKG